MTTVAIHVTCNSVNKRFMSSPIKPTVAPKQIYVESLPRLYKTDSLFSVTALAPQELETIVNEGFVAIPTNPPHMPTQ